MTRRVNLRLMLALAPALFLGTIAVALAENVEPADWRFVLLFTAVGAVAACSWRVGAAALGGTLTRAHGVPRRLSLVARSERVAPMLDRETGIYAGWYFRLRIDEEIARAERYGQAFTVIGVGADSPETLAMIRRLALESLRDVDFAGDLDGTLALCLPNTSRSGAWRVAARLTETARSLELRLAEYPSDGSTLASLLGEARLDGIRKFAA